MWPPSLYIVGATRNPERDETMPPKSMPICTLIAAYANLP